MFVDLRAPNSFVQVSELQVTTNEAEEKLNQRQFFFWYMREYKQDITRALNQLKRPDLLKKLFR